MAMVMSLVGTKKQVEPKQRLCSWAVIAQQLKKFKRVWKKGGCTRRNGFDLLPMELVNDILWRLPPRYLCVVRAVCREWDMIVRSHDFLSKHMIGDDGCGERLDGPTLALVDLGCDKRSFVAFNVEFKRWMRVPSFYEGPEVETGCGIVACAKGLVVYNITRLPKLKETYAHMEWRIGRLQFVVRNPLLGTSKVLPPTNRNFRYASSAAETTVMLEVLDGSGGVQGYKITVLYPRYLGFAGFMGGEIYDSRVGHWVAFNIAPWQVNRNLFYLRTRHVVLDGDMYRVDYPIKLKWKFVDGTERRTLMVRHGRIVAFNMKDHNWRVVHNMKLEKIVCPHYNQISRDSEYSYDDPQLAAYLVFVVLSLVPSCGTHYHAKVPFLGWMAFLDVRSNKLVHRAIVPGEMVALLGPNTRRYMVASAGDYVCICNPNNRGKMVAYNFCRKEWEQWPRCPYPLDNDGEEWESLFRGSICFSHNGVSGGKKARSLIDYQLSYLPV